MLGAVTSAKNARLEGLEWKYPESAEHQARWLAACVRQTNLKAASIAQALGAELLGVHSISEQPAPQPQTHQVVAAFGEVRRRSAAVDLGFELSERKRVTLRVTAEYRIRGFAPPDAPGV